jgi:hypothetical protein
VVAVEHLLALALRAVRAAIENQHYQFLLVLHTRLLSVQVELELLVTVLMATIQFLVL